MPSAIRRLFNFSSKKKSHHGQKFQEFHGYENQRFPTYPTITQNLTHPQYYQQHQQQQNLIQHSYQQNQYQQAQPSSHSFSHRQQHQPQFQQQNTIVQSPQLISTPSVTTTLNQCPCQHCAVPNLPGYNHQSQTNLGQTMSPPQAIVSPPVAPPQIQMVNTQIPPPSTTLQVQPVVLTHQPPHQPQHQHQQQQATLMQQDHQGFQQQCIQASHPQQQQQHHHHQQQQQQQQQQINSPCNDMTHQYANQINEYASQAAQCTCHHCPNHSQRALQPQNQQVHQNHMAPHIDEQPQQQIFQHTINPPQMHQQLDLIQPNNICQHQVVTGQMPLNQVMQQSCSSQYTVSSKNQLFASHDQNQSSSMIMSSSTPRTQHQEHGQQQQQQASPYQQQYTNTNTIGAPKFHYHTIQANQYQQQKQQQVSQQHHRIQSLHHQVSQSPNQLNENQMSHVIQPTTQSHPPVESRMHEFSRYANVRSIIDESLKTRRTTSQSSKYQEHVYCNQKPELTLPPYESPPTYETFLENRKSYIIGMSGQHMTHHSESLASQKTKDSSYENLRRFSPYGNLGEDRQEPGLTSRAWDDNCSSLLPTEMKEDSSRTKTSLVC